VQVETASNVVKGVVASVTKDGGTILVEVRKKEIEIMIMWCVPIRHIVRRRECVCGCVWESERERERRVFQGEGTGTHPASILNAPPSFKIEPYQADIVHPATLLLGFFLIFCALLSLSLFSLFFFLAHMLTCVCVLGRGRNGTLTYWNDDARPEGRVIHLEKGDPVNLVMCSHITDPCSRRAVQISTRAKTVTAVKKPAVIAPVTTRRPLFLRTSQIQAIQQGKSIPGDGTDEETDDSIDEATNSNENNNENNNNETTGGGEEANGEREPKE